MDVQNEVDRGRPRTTIFYFYRTFEDEGVPSEIRVETEDVRDGNENIRGPQISKNFGTSKDEDFEVPRRPDSEEHL